MYTKPAQEHQAQFLYLQTDLTQQEIADLLSINRRTLYNWIRDGNWKRAKYIAKYAPPLLAEQYYTQLGALNSEIAGREERPYPTKEEAEIIRKLTISIKHIQGDKDPIVSDLNTFMEFAHELRLKDKGIAEQMIVHMDEYIQARVREGSSLDTGWRTFLKDKAEEQEYEQWQRDQDIATSNRNHKRQQASEEGNPHISFIPLAEENHNEQTDGNSETTENTAEHLPVNDLSENEATENTQTKSDAQQENSYKGAGPVYYTGYLEEYYNITKDPHVKRYTTETMGITIIKSPSPLWGIGKCLFFDERQ